MRISGEMQASLGLMPPKLSRIQPAQAQRKAKAEALSYTCVQDPMPPAAQKIRREVSGVF